MKSKRALAPVLFVLSVLLVFGISRCFNRYSDLQYQKVQELLAAADSNIFCTPIDFTNTTCVLFSDQMCQIYEASSSFFRLDSNPFEKSVIASPTEANAIFPVDNGVGYITSKGLIYYNRNVYETVAEDILAACWDGSSFVWIDSEADTVLTQIDGQETALLQLNTDVHDEPRRYYAPILLASDRWVVVSVIEPENTLSDIYDICILDRQTRKVVFCQMSVDSWDVAFLCGDKLVMIGGYQNTFCVLNLVDMQKTQYETDIITGEGHVTASAVYDNDRDIFYVSVFSKPNSWDYYPENGGTFAIDFRDGTLTMLNEQYYPMLCLDNHNLFGITEAKVFCGVRLHQIV